MDSNYQWQKHQVDERSQARLREAETHRLLKENSPPRAPFIVRVFKWVFRLVAAAGQDRKRTSKESERSQKKRVVI